MKSCFIFYLFVLNVIVTYAQPSEWKIAEGKITTPWANEVNPSSVLPEYPRPQMVRSQWLNLNGIWDYAIGTWDKRPDSYVGKILVPFPVESALSGVGKRINKESALWYRRKVEIPSSFRGKSVLLHFGAVDWRCEVFVNGTPVGYHEGGYDPFFFDISKALKKGSQEISIRVFDPSDEGPQPRGKQVKEPNSIWYTPVTGIWQTVWIEAVPPTYLSGVKITPDVDKKQFHIVPTINGKKNGDKIRVTLLSNDKKVTEQETGDSLVHLTIANVVLWSPENPHLYDMNVAIIRNGRVIDEVRTYSAMRKIAMKKDRAGVNRMQLNDRFVFQYGPLDQGWWPDGLYTAPTDEALRFDVEKTKAMGFNMIRKHVKVEPARWYYHCDRIGLLVWQDMPSGDMGNRWDSRPAILGIATEKDRTAESERIFRKEWKAIMDATYHFPCIVVWVPFNEAWGQFKTEEIVKWTLQYDTTRLVNGASGGNFTKAGHIIDLHNYPSPAMPDPAIFGSQQIIVLGEFGGLGLPLEGHTWQSKDNWGYQSFSTAEEMMGKYESFINSLSVLIAKGLSAAVYTQTTDVEIETNGLMTYDRKVVKFPQEKLKALHSGLYNVNVE
jgi:beta-galactosidase/beta-glucuronidase